MKKLIMPLAVVVAVGFYAGSASAQCTFGFDGGTPETSRGPAPAKGLKGNLVRTYAGCTSTEHPTEDTNTEAGTPACSPVIPPELDGGPTPYAYSEKGKCTVQTQAKLLKDCSKAEDSAGNGLGLDERPCHVTFVRSSCKGVVRADGVTGINGAIDDGWELKTLSRASLNDPTNQDVTVIDFPVAFSYSLLRKARWKSTAAARKHCSRWSAPTALPCRHARRSNSSTSSSSTRTDVSSPSSAARPFRSKSGLASASLSRS